MILQAANDLLQPLFESHEPPCVTVYAPLERAAADRRKSAIVFRNLIRDAEAALERDYPDDRRAMVARLHRLDTEEVWNGPGDGLAVFLSKDFDLHLHLPIAVREMAVVSDSFQIRPVLRYLAARNRYHVLGIRRGDVQFLAGWREHLELIDIPGMPHTLRDVVPAADLDRSNVHFHAGDSRGRSPIYHSPGEEKPDIDADLRKFFHAVDDRLVRHLGSSTLPVVLVAQPQHAAIYRDVSRLQHLLEETVADGTQSSLAELARRTWETVERHNRRQIRSRIERLEEACSKGMGGDDIAEVSRQAAAGRIATLFLEEGCRVWGHLDRGTGAVQIVDGAPPPGENDILDDLAELVLERRGEVVIAEPSSLPAASGIGAIYRYPEPSPSA